MASKKIGLFFLFIMPLMATCGNSIIGVWYLNNIAITHNNGEITTHNTAKIICDQTQRRLTITDKYMLCLSPTHTGSYAYTIANNTLSIKLLQIIPAQYADSNLLWQQLMTESWETYKAHTVTDSTLTVQCTIKGVAALFTYHKTPGVQWVLKKIITRNVATNEVTQTEDVPDTIKTLPRFGTCLNGYSYNDGCNTCGCNIKTDQANNILDAGCICTRMYCDFLQLSVIEQKVLTCLKRIKHMEIKNNILVVTYKAKDMCGELIFYPQLIKTDK